MPIKYYPYKKEDKPNLRPLYFEYFNEVCEPAIVKFMQTKPTPEEANGHNVSIEIKINGIKVDAEQFFEHFFEIFKMKVRVEAKKICSTQAKVISNKMVDAIKEFNGRLEDLRQEAYHSIDNNLKEYE